MPELTADSVITEVDSLQNDIQGRDLRRDVLRRRQQHAMTDQPWLPDHVTARGITAIMPSVEPAYLAQTIGADMSSYITTTTVIPGKPDLIHKADAVEKRYALERAELFPVELRARMRWNQMITGFGVYQFGTAGIQSQHPWWVSMPDPNSTFFRILNGCRPPLVGRKYTQTVRELEHNHSYWDKRQMRRPRMASGGKWDWEPIRFDIATEDYQGSFNNGREAGEDVDFVELDTGQDTYCVALNRDKKGGMVVWHQKNLGGPGTQYMIVPGHMTDARELREMILPFLWAPMNIANQLQLVDTLRMTRSLNVKPQVLIDRNPDLLAAARALGIARDVPEGQPIVGDSLIEVDGHPYFWAVPSDEDLDKLEGRLEERLARYSQTQLALTTGEVVANVTVGGLQLALGARQRQQGPMLTFEDVAEARILGMVKASIMADEGGYGADDWSLFARTLERYGKGETKRGDYATFNRDMLDFEHDIDVTTASKTREEAALEVQNWNQRKISRLSTWREGLGAAGYPNEEEQHLALIQEEGYELAAGIAGNTIASSVVIDRWRERGGIDISGYVAMGQQPMAGAPAGAPSGAPGNARQVPTTGGAAGGAVQPELTSPPKQPGGMSQ